MTDKTYRIKALEWKEKGIGFHYVAVTRVANYMVFKYHDTDTEWYWYYGDFGVGSIPFNCSSLEDGKQQAEAHYLERISSCLEEMK